MTTMPATEARRRATAYVVTGLVLAVLAALFWRRGWVAGPAGPRLVEMSATVLALVCGVLSLVRHYSRRERHFLFVGVTLLGATLFDAFQVMALLRADASPVAVVAAQWGWLASRIYLGVFLARLSIAPRRRVRADLEFEETALYGVATVFTAAGLALLTLAPLPPLGGVTRFVGQLIPLTLFTGALVANLRRGAWQRNAFEHWLIIALLLSIGAQVLMLSGPERLDSAAMFAARFIKLLSYVALFVGLLASVFFTYGALEDSRQALAAANRALQREINDRQATERELQIRTAFLEHLFESAPEAIVLLDREDRVQRMNAEFTRMFGYTADEALGRPIGALIVPPDRAGEADSFSENVARGVTVSAESVRRRRDGLLVDVSILGTPVLVADGQIGVYGIYRDITDRKRAEQSMRRSAERLAAIIEASPLAIFTVDEERVVRTWNPAAERLTGQLARDVLGRPLGELELADDDATSASLRVALSGTVDRRTEAVWTRADGQQIHVAIATAPLEGADLSRGVLVVAADVTEQKRAEEAILAAKAAAEEANRSKSEFLASMSHELRTPLNSVIGFTRVLLRNKTGTLGGTEITYLERIGANGEHLLGLINDILDLSKIEARMLQIELAETDLIGLVRETVAQLEGRMTGGPVVLRAKLPDGTVPFVTDAHRLRQVIINLVGNAQKFTHEGEIVVALDTEQSGRPLQIRVSDTGIGIPADRLGMIFEAFEQADRSTARRYGGTGLGLSISRGICQSLGYDLTVESKPGVGSTFSITFGATPAGQALLEEAASA